MAAAEKKVEPAQSDKNPLAADTALTAGAKPEGLPGLWPLHAMPRRRRAEAVRQMAVVTEKFSKLSDEQPDENGEIELDMSKVGVMADAIEVMADIEDYLVAVAQPGHEDQVKEWALAADDSALMAAFGWYVRTFQPGEA